MASAAVGDTYEDFLRGVLLHVSSIIAQFAVKFIWPADTSRLSTVLKVANLITVAAVEFTSAGAACCRTCMLPSFSLGLSCSTRKAEGLLAVWKRSPWHVSRHGGVGRPAASRLGFMELTFLGSDRELQFPEHTSA